MFRRRFGKKRYRLLTEFDEEKYRRTIYRQGYEDGKQEGFDKGKQEGYDEGRHSLLREKVKKKLEHGKAAAEIAKDLEFDLQIIEEIIKEIGQ